MMFTPSGVAPFQFGPMIQYLPPCPFVSRVPIPAKLSVKASMKVMLK